MSEIKKYRHVHIRGLGQVSEEFKAQGRGSTKRPAAVENRAEHAEQLREGLDVVAGEFDAFVAEQKSEGVPQTKRGIPVTVEGRPNVALDVGTSRSTTRGLNLLNVKRVAAGLPNNEGNRDQATFFVNSTVLRSLTKNLDRYAEWVDEEADDDERRPRNFWLFESGALIRPAQIRDFWTDDVDQFPRRRSQFRWEIWTRTGYEKPFASVLERLQLETIGRATEFVETIVQTIVATPEQVQQLIRASAAVVELRSASSFAPNYLDVPSQQSLKTVSSLAVRLNPAGKGAPRIAVLDTGVQHSHPLLSGSLPASRCKTVEAIWKASDHHGHGTQMAGLALLGDLDPLSKTTGPISLTTALESVVVTGPETGPLVPARDALQEAVEILEAAKHPRIFCLAQTAQGEAETGRPTSTSAVVDQVSFNDGWATRLICAAIGNVPHSDEEPYQIADYKDRNARFGIQSPAQALNALSVGAASLKDKKVVGGELVAPVGDLAPTSRTAQSWLSPHPHKPDIVMEGGNFLVDDDEIFSHPSKRHLVLTTAATSPKVPLTFSGETSTATALASGLAARLLAAYPNFRMETIRGLMVHAARWTDVMEEHAVLARLSGTSVADSWLSIISRFGWGVPDEKLLFGSAANALTLIIEDDLQPYELVDGAIRLKEMKYFKLPWPKSALEALEQTQVKLRCTLSYFVEPDPHAASRDRLERYASHRLKFDVKRFGESDKSAQQRFNALIADDTPFSSLADEGWILGPTKQRGTLHNDVWTGPAYQLADRDGISVAPIRGWWGDMPNLEYHKNRVRFSLIASIETPENSGDLVNEALSKVNAKLLVESAAVIANV